MSAWLVLAVCASLKGECVWAPRDPLPSPEACAQYGRRLQLGRGLAMNSFRCLKVEVKS